MRRSDKTHIMERNGKRETVSIDRLEYAHLEKTSTNAFGPPPFAPPATPVPTSPARSIPLNPATPLEQAPGPSPLHRIISLGRALKPPVLTSTREKNLGQENAARKKIGTFSTATTTPAY
ncbi:unnamed protein product [Echinostoma caproni]|uniref:WH2 domain-containing protein n=1 Tax=Echinostoma caproni TaxID=27848 RepID=A0A183BDN9_9TREM|nr:unnamed protein product [Echinostoma caproni]